MPFFPQETSAGPIVCGLWDNSMKYLFWGREIRLQQEFTEHHIWPFSFKTSLFPFLLAQALRLFIHALSHLSVRYTRASSWDPAIYQKDNLSSAYMYFLSWLLIQVLSLGVSIGKNLLHISKVKQHQICSFLLEWNLHGDNCIIKLRELFTE